MQNYVTLILVVIMIGGFAFIGVIATTTLALPLDFLDNTYVFGPITGLTQDNNGTIDWVLAGVWRASLPNATDASSNANSSSFNAAIEMMRPDGTGRHTHTVTDFTFPFSIWKGKTAEPNSGSVKVAKKRSAPKLSNFAYVSG